MSFERASEYFIEKISENKEDSKIVSFPAPKTLLREVDVLCKMQGMSRSYFLREAIKLAIAQSKAHKDKGFIYLIQADDSSRFKIGRSKDVARRLAELRFSNPFDLNLRHTVETNNMAKTEKFFHDHFHSKRINAGEWFRLNDEDVKWFENKGYLGVEHIRESIQE